MNSCSVVISETDQPFNSEVLATLTRREDEEKMKEERRLNDEGRKMAAKGVISGWIGSHHMFKQQQQTKPEDPQGKESQEHPQVALGKTSDVRSYISNQDPVVKGGDNSPSKSPLQPPPEERRRTRSATISVPSRGRASAWKRACMSDWNNCLVSLDLSVCS